jgi:hypothetical protein
MRPSLSCGNPDSQPAGVPYARSVLELLKEGQALVPSLFFLEVANVISKLEGKADLPRRTHSVIWLCWAD